MKKKITAIFLCVALVAIAVVGASLAYFTDTKSATNTFTVGNVKINLIESKFHREGNDNSGDTSIPDPTHKVTADDGMEYVTTGHTMFTDDEIKADAETYQTDYLAVKGENMVPGRGVRASVAGRDVAAGNREMLAELGVDGADALQAAALPFAEQGCTVVLAALDGQAAGFIALADTVRPTAEAAVRGIRTLGVEPVLLTGDHAQAARHIAAQAGIVEVEADCLPQNKLAAVERLEREGAPVCMVGDGINDAPALKRASVGIAMGGAGSDIAVDAADIALVRDDIAALPHLLAISQRMMTTIKLNMGFSLGLNFVAIALAMTGILNPVVGALVHNAGSVIVIVNSALLLKWKHRGGSEASGDASPASAPGAATALRDLEPDAEAA